MTTNHLEAKDLKKEILNNQVKTMLESDNPLEGIYGMYGDHPDKKDILQSIKFENFSA